MRYIKAQKALKHSVVYTNENGRYFRHFGGTVAWRNHNPGNLRPGKISKRHNQIGVIDGFAVFPDYQSGHDALIDLIRTRYRNLSIPGMMKYYAPKNENNTKRYIKFLQNITGVTDTTKIKDFTEAQFKNLWKGIEKMESYKKGSVVEAYKITMTQVTKNNRICTYFIENNRWIDKKDCIALARTKQLELEVCRSRLGNIYLRATGVSPFQKDLYRLIKK